MATYRKHLLAAQSSWQARHRLYFAGGPGLSQGGQSVLSGTWGEDLRTGRGPTNRDRSVSTGPPEERHRQPAQVPAGQSDSRASLEGRQPDFGSEDLQKQTNRRNGESEGV